MKLRDILEHTKYLYKKIFNWFPYAKVFFPMTIILGVFLPFFSSAIPSIIVQMLTIHRNSHFYCNISWSHFYRIYTESN